MHSVLDAMASIQSEDDRWHLAEELHRLIRSGTQGFDAIIDEANKEGVAGGLSATTLRLYRDTAARWPKSHRVPGVSFSAHREAMVMIAKDGNTAKAEKLLKDVTKAHGTSGVTVARVRAAAAAAQGKVPKSSKAKTTAKGFDVLTDLENGGSQLIAALSAIQSDNVKLDKVHVSLSKALQRVEQYRSKLARVNKGTAAKTPATKVTPKQTPKATATNGKGKSTAKRGDLRDL